MKRHRLGYKSHFRDNFRPEYHIFEKCPGHPWWFSPTLSLTFSGLVSIKATEGLKVVGKSATKPWKVVGKNATTAPKLLWFSRLMKTPRFCYSAAFPYCNDSSRFWGFWEKCRFKFWGNWEKLHDKKWGGHPESTYIQKGQSQLGADWGGQFSADSPKLI